MTKKIYKNFFQIKDNKDGPLIFSGTFPVQASYIDENVTFKEEEEEIDGKVYVNGRINAGGLLKYFQGLTIDGDPVLSANIGGQNLCLVYSDQDLSGTDIEVIVGGVFIF